ncbi:MAG: hypothetical protein Q9167_005794 [Letrouitia subvulpina]
MAAVANEAASNGSVGHCRRKDSTLQSRSYGAANGTANGAANGHLTGTSGSDTSDEDLSLPPADHGTAAWLFLAGCFWLEFFVWGLPFSFGAFEKYYSNHVKLSSEKGIAAIGTTCMGFAYFIGPFTLAILQRWPSQRRRISLLGLVVLLAGLIIASFATHVIHLVFTQGLLYGIGSALLYNPFLFYMDEWFIKRKGLAYSIFWAGTGFSGAAIPFLMDWALNTYGFRVTLRAWAFVLPRRPLPANGVTLRINYDFLRNPLFWAFQFGNIIEGLGYFVPQVYLTSFAKSIGFSDVTAIASLSVLNAFSAVGLIAIGFLVDRYHISTVLLLSAVTSTFCVFVLWGFALNLTVLFAFAITFGIFAGGYVACWTGCALEVKKTTTNADIATMVGFMAAGRGFGCVFCGPMSEFLLGLGALNASGAYGTKYGILIILTGVTSLMGRFGLFGRFGLQAGSPVIKQPETAAGEHEPLLR